MGGRHLYVMANAFTTELEAINIILQIIDEEPVETIQGEQPLEVTSAINTLREINREIQQMGWHFNTEYKYPLMPESDGTITLPQSTLEFDVDPRYGSDCKEYIQRGVKVYNRTDRTYNIGKKLEATIVSFLDWEDMPEPFRRWVFIRAGKIVSNRSIGDGATNSFTQMNEMEAKGAAINYDARNKDATIFDSNVANSIINRRMRSGSTLRYGNY